MPHQDILQLESDICSKKITEIDTWPFIREQRQWPFPKIEEEEKLRLNLKNDYFLRAAKMEERVRELQEKKLQFKTLIMGIFLGLMGGLVSGFVFLPHDFKFSNVGITIALEIFVLLSLFTLLCFIWLNPKLNHPIRVAFRWEKTMGTENSLFPDEQKKLSLKVLKTENPHFKEKLNQFAYLLFICLLRDQLDYEKSLLKEPFKVKVSKLTQSSFTRPIFNFTFDFITLGSFLTTKNEKILSDLESYNDVIINAQIKADAFYFDDNIDTWHKQGSEYFEKIQSLDIQKIIKKVVSQITA